MNPHEALPAIFAIPVAIGLSLTYALMLWHDRTREELEAMQEGVERG